MTALLIALTMSQDIFPVVDGRVDSAVKSAFAEFKTLKPEQLAVTFIDLSKGEQEDYRGNEPFYPASVIKVFWLAFAHHRMETGFLKQTPELDRAIADMIKDSSNDATGLVVDMTTGTTGGPELPPEEFEAWTQKRQAANEWFRSIGINGQNVCQKTWGDGPYGRERQSYGAKFENRNSLTTNGTARLWAEIAKGTLVSEKRSKAMLAVLRRDNPADKKTSDGQASDYIGAALPKGATLYSKAGWVSNERHDSALVEMPDGRRLILVIFTKGHSNEQRLIPYIAGKLLGS